MKKVVKSDQGFTLVELMVVVAIIGILSAIAVPNFKRYQAKSKQSEAKIQLAAVYSTEISSQADYDGYASCLSELGYDTPARGYYTVGFPAAFQTSVTDRGGTCTATVLYPPTTLRKAHAGAAAITTANVGGATPTATSFTAGATGSVTTNATTLDTWTINESKNLLNSSPGIN